MSKVRAIFLTYFVMVGIAIEIAVSEIGRASDVAFVITIVICMSAWFIRCEKCGRRAVLNESGKIVSSFGFMFCGKCPYCGV